MYHRAISKPLRLAVIILAWPLLVIGMASAGAVCATVGAWRAACDVVGL